MLKSAFFSSLFTGDLHSVMQRLEKAGSEKTDLARKEKHLANLFNRRYRLSIDRGFLLILLLFFLFLLGCVVEDTKLETDNQTIILPNGSCNPRWGCISSIYKAYQLENCSWVEKKECELGCMEGQCKIAKTCTRGYKC